MSDQQTRDDDIDAVIERIRAEAAAEEAGQSGRFIVDRKPIALELRATGAPKHRICRALVRRFGWLRYRLRAALLRPLHRFARLPLRPATNRAMLQVVNRIEQLEQQGEDYFDRFESSLQEQSELLADTKSDAEETKEKLFATVDALQSDLEAAKSALGSRLASMDELLEAASRRFDHQASEMTMLREDISRVRMEAQLRLYHLDRLAAWLESGTDRFSADSAGHSPAQVASTAASDGALDAYYLAFENACRGDEADIAAQLRADYLQTVQAALARTGEGGALDIGCGRGEWLRVLAEAGIQASGIDLSPVMAEHCCGQGLDVVACDAVQALADRPAESLTVISGFHIIEHLPFAVLYRLLEEVARVLRPEGLFIFETPNPENVLVSSHTFYHDATHSNPLTPTAMRFLAKYHGFHPVEIRRLHPYPTEARVPGSDPLTERVNGHLCGPQDYALIGQKPTA